MAKTYDNIDEFAEAFMVPGLGDGSSLFELGRLLNKYFYKGTDCGGWLELEQWPYLDINPNTGIDETDVKAVIIGTIIEGSDAELGPYRFEFPINRDMFWQQVEDMNQEAAALWEEANS